MKNLLLIIAFLLLCQFANAQVYFDGLEHSTVGNVELQIVDDTLKMINMNPDQISGLDIALGETKGFGFTFSEIDPVANPNGAYQEWRMLGTLDGVEDQLLWTERHEVNNQNDLARIDVIFDSSPVQPESNGIRILKNNTLVYEGAFENGLIYTIEVDLSIVSATDFYCRPIPEKWDATCVAKPIIIFPQTIVTPDGTSTFFDTGDIAEIETFAINPALPPSLCSKVENRSFQSPLSQFYDEGIVMFETRIPFYSIGDIIYETDLDFLRIFEIDNTGEEGVRIPLDKASSFDLDWMPIMDYGDNYAIEISSEGLVNNVTQTLGRVRHELDPNSGAFQITADFSTFDTEDKIIQVLQDGNVVQEFSEFSESYIASLNSLPSGCGKLALTVVDSPDVTVCYFMDFQQEVDFEIQGVNITGDEIRILSMTNTPVEYLSEFKVLLSDMNEFVITQADETTSVNNNDLSFQKEYFNIFPNPVKDVLNIQMIEDGWREFEYMIFDSMGLLILQDKSNDNQINVSTLSTGIYYVQIKNDDHFFIVKMIKINK